MDDGVRGAFHVSQVMAGRKNRIALEVTGTLCSMAWDSEDPEHLWIGRRDGPNELLTRDPSLLSDLSSALSHSPR